MMDHGINTFEMLKTLSDDAKIILGGCFGVMGIPGKSTLTFQMKESRPTARAKAALDDCVRAGALSQRSLVGGGVEYLVQVNCSGFGKWAQRNRSKGKWPMTEPVTRPHKD
jgi:hypothetical protein